MSSAMPNHRGAYLGIMKREGKQELIKENEESVTKTEGAEWTQSAYPESHRRKRANHCQDKRFLGHGYGECDHDT